MVKKITDPLLEDEILPVEKEEIPVVAVKKVIKPVTVDTVATTKAILDAQEKVNFIIPMSDGEAPGAYDTVQINGYKLTIQKGVMVALPMAVANLLAEKYRINMTAGMEKRIDRTSATAEALA